MHSPRGAIIWVLAAGTWALPVALAWLFRRRHQRQKPAPVTRLPARVQPQARHIRPYNTGPAVTIGPGTTQDPEGNHP